MTNEEGSAIALKFRAPERVYIVGLNEWRGQYGICRGFGMANNKRYGRQRAYVLVELEMGRERVGFFTGELVSANPLERLANLDDEEE
jgi:hypothetical protein